MDMKSLGKNILGQLMVMNLILTSCTPTGSVRNAATTDGSTATTTGSGSGNNATEGNNSVGNGTTTTVPTVEIRHLIEPNLSSDTTYSTGTGQAGGGSYVRKLTLPKNYAGRLYIAGINITSLNSSFVKVRFRFGVGRQALTSDIPATIMKAPGITPSTDISILAMDLRSQPFRNVRLSYDLFDYTSYDTDGDGIDFNNGESPTQDNRDSNLYCRGLLLGDDPTFSGVGACDSSDEECLYAYAKVTDQGLIQQSGSVLVPLSPSLPQYKSVTGSNYYQDYPYQTVKKPMLDTIPLLTPGSHDVGTIPVSQVSTTFNSPLASFVNPTNIWDRVLVGSYYYYYRGPYRLMNMAEWQFGFPYSDIHGPGKLFRKDSYVNYPNYLTNPLPDETSVPPKQSRLYYNSYLFPIATKLNLGANVTHLSSSSVLGPRSENVLTTAGQTMWMDGSNARAQSRDTELNHIGSCNVTSSIDIIAQDKNGTDYVIASSIDVKLQLVRATQYSTSVGDDVLYSNFKTCTVNETCGGTSCCLNNRCWDETLISQCSQEGTSTGNKVVGESCTTDYQCSSFCCNKTSGTCASHNTLLATPVLCNKQTGDSCIAKEFCAQSQIKTCIIVKTGTTASGATTCRQQCYYENVNGDCKNGICVPPTQPTIPTFDPDASGACDSAVTAPSF